MPTLACRALAILLQRLVCVLASYTTVFYACCALRRLSITPRPATSAPLVAPPAPHVASPVTCMLQLASRLPPGHLCKCAAPFAPCVHSPLLPACGLLPVPSVRVPSSCVDPFSFCQGAASFHAPDVWHAYYETCLIIIHNQAAAACLPRTSIMHAGVTPTWHMASARR